MLHNIYIDHKNSRNDLSLVHDSPNSKLMKKSSTSMRFSTKSNDTNFRQSRKYQNITQKLPTVNKNLFEDLDVENKSIILIPEDEPEEELDIQIYEKPKKDKPLLSRQASLKAGKNNDVNGMKSLLPPKAPKATKKSHHKKKKSTLEQITMNTDIDTFIERSLENAAKKGSNTHESAHSNFHTQFRKRESLSHTKKFLKFKKNTMKKAVKHKN